MPGSVVGGWRTRHPPNRVANIVGDEQSAAPIDSQADRPSVRVIDRDGRIGNDAAFSMNDVWARTVADAINGTGSTKLNGLKRIRGPGQRIRSWDFRNVSMHFCRPMRSSFDKRGSRTWRQPCRPTTPGSESVTPSLEL